MMRGFKYYGAPMTQNECYSNLIAPGSTHKGGGFGPCPLFNGTSKLPAVQSNGVFPEDLDAVDMVSQRHLPPYFLGHFSPVLRRLFAVILRFPAF